MNEDALKLHCVCGAALEDFDEKLPSAGVLIAGDAYKDLLAKALAEFSSFLGASAEARDAWLTKHFGKQWPKRSDAAHLEELIHTLIMSHSRPVYECQACGRLMIDQCTHNSIELVEYLPVHNNVRLFTVRPWWPE